LQGQRSCLLSCYNDYNQSEEALDKLIADFSEHPDFPETLYWIAERYRWAREYEQAKNLYEQVMQDYPDSVYASRAELGLSTANFMSIFISQGDDQAEEALDKMVADFNDHPDLAKTIFVIGELYYNNALGNAKEGLTDQAEANFARTISVWERIITQLPESKLTILQDAYYFAAACYRRLGEYEKAIQYWQKIVDDWPDYQYAWSAQCLIGECYEKLRNSGTISQSEANPEIEQAYKAVIEKYPDCSLVGHACLKLAQPNFAKGRWAEAATYFELFLEKAPEDPRRVNVLYDLGRAYEQMGELNLAAEVYRIFIETANPGDSRVKTVKAELEKLEGVKK